MEEKDLSPKQRKWLETSKKIGLGPMTKTERQTLNDLYADMLPAEQQELADHIEEKFGYDIDETPIKEQENKEYAEPSDALKAAIGASRLKDPSNEDKK
jgi:hypothetical protein